ncbi:MAG: dTDP-4-amino-4,6-dideoxygalactose transaminase [Polyangiales bacterium]
MTIRIPFNRPPYTGHEDRHVLEAMRSGHQSGDGPFGRKCEAWLQVQIPSARALLTPSCTHALEMMALLLEIGPGDEVIMPSFTFVSTANAFALRGAKIVFVDVRPDTMNIDERLIEAAITSRTKAIVVVHYAGVPCEMDRICALAQQHALAVVEDAAQALGSTYRGQPAGGFGRLSAFSFHETKNVTSAGDGGALLVRDPALVQRAEVIREKGTNRSQFFRGMADKYTWVDVGSSYLMSEVQAAYLLGQLEHVDEIQARRRAIWSRYLEALRPLQAQGHVELAQIPPHCGHNAHLFFLKCRDLAVRTRLIAHLRSAGILAVFHYVPLHSSTAGLRFGRFHGEDRITTAHSERLLRLPVFHSLTEAEQGEVIDCVKAFFASEPGASAPGVARDART